VKRARRTAAKPIEFTLFSQVVRMATQTRAAAVHENAGNASQQVLYSARRAFIAYSPSVVAGYALRDWHVRALERILPSVVSRRQTDKNQSFGSQQRTIAWSGEKGTREGRKKKGANGFREFAFLTRGGKRSFEQTHL